MKKPYNRVCVSLVSEKKNGKKNSSDYSKGDSQHDWVCGCIQNLTSKEIFYVNRVRSMA